MAAGGSMRDRSHRRFNPLLREWVLVSPHRLSRPWQGRTEPADADERPRYDASCYLCPGNERANDVRNPMYEGTFVFDNDYPALTTDSGPVDRTAHDPSDLLTAEPESGICRVVCFSPRHDLSVPQLSAEEMHRVVAVWTAQYMELGSDLRLNHVQIFENRGAAMGASNPHPHCQVWATEHVPDIPRREQVALFDFASTHRACLLCSYVATELNAQERFIASNDHFLAVVPFWAVWPFEVLVVARRHVTGLDLLSESEREGFAHSLQDVTRRLDRLFESACPYSMGIHQRPTDGEPHDEAHLHAHYYPPVLRSATIHKFMVGFELLGTPQRDLTPELAAERLREVGGRSLV
jgi:UDPglucose--hexose-1-phosphate uridylyltransferase